TTKAETMNSRCNGASNDAADMAAKPLESGSGRSGPADLTLKWNILLYFRKYRAKKVTSNSELPERQLNLAHFPLFGECINSRPAPCAPRRANPRRHGRTVLIASASSLREKSFLDKYAPSGNWKKSFFERQT